MFVSPKEASQKLKVSEQTLRNWADSGEIEYLTTEGGHRRYNIQTNIKPAIKKNILYARVSSKKQEEDLERQVKFLQEKYPDYEVVRDIGSGINYKRKGFKRILEYLFKGNIGEVIVTHNDRFARYGDFFEYLFDQFNSKLVSLSDPEEKNSDVELAEDLMEIITVFSARYYGKRKYQSKPQD